MMAIRYAVIDDEPAAHRVLEVLMRAHPRFVRTGGYFGPAEAIAGIRAQPVDLLFVDIRMPGGDGLELLRSLPHPPLSVATTAASDHALRAYEIGVRDYLLKPISAERLAVCLQRLQPLLDVRLGESAAPAADTPKLVFASGHRHRLIARATVLAVDADGNFSRLLSTDGVVMVSESLKSLEARLSGHGFLRCHKRHLVNLSHIQSISGGSLRLSGGIERPLGRLYRERVREALSTPHMM
jgi:two-component system, LytTR family, response regulator LytT